MIGALAGGLALAFGWLQFRGIEFGPLVKDVSADVLFKVVLAACCACWVAGTTWDTDDQELLYFRPPRKGKIPVVAYGGAVTLAADGTAKRSEV